MARPDSVRSFVLANDGDAGKAVRRLVRLDLSKTVAAKLVRNKKFVKSLYARACEKSRKIEQFCERRVSRRHGRTRNGRVGA
jgi:hypothetical protein